jgi:asparagine synthase (glutamine-hydrolysing)
MCGIAGILNFDRTGVSTGELEEMCRRLRHRGPDDAGWHAAGPIGLASTRLRVIDLTQNAHQPLFNEDRSVAVVLNGEIYNFLALKEFLLKRGHQFRSSSDTETIVHLYEEYGSECIAKLDGMFAIAIWDSKCGRLLLARDRTGKKPLHYHEGQKRIVFGSEIKALFANEEVPRRVATRSLSIYLAFGYVPCPNTLYDEILQVEPATFVTVSESGDTQSRRYWSFEPDPRPIAPRQAAIELRAHLSQAVKKRLVADVPVGVFLSGGIDSSIVVAEASELSQAPVRTFTIGFDDEPSLDERRYARMVAERFRTDHHEFVVGPQSVDLVDTLVRSYDQPFMDSSAIPTYLIAKLAREHVTVILNGDGGDESFAGYRWFQVALAAERSPRVVLNLLKFASISLRRLKPSLARTLARLKASADVEPGLRFWAVMPLFASRLWGRLRPEFAVSPVEILEHARTLKGRATGLSPLNRLLAYSLWDYLLNDLNVKMDRCTMAHGLEARSPFLDTEVLEFAGSLPTSMKLRGLRTKRLLREAYRDRLPALISRRSKQGFSVPLTSWFRSDLREYVGDLFTSSDSRVLEYFEPRELRRLVEDFLSGKYLGADTLWTLLTLETWLRLESEASSSERAPSQAVSQK